MDREKNKTKEKTSLSRTDIIIKKPVKRIKFGIDFVPSSAILSSKVIEHEIDKVNKGFRNRINTVTPSEIWIG